jgi:hypothetical protein
MLLHGLNSSLFHRLICRGARRRRRRAPPRGGRMVMVGYTRQINRGAAAAIGPPLTKFFFDIRQSPKG